MKFYVLVKDEFLHFGGKMSSVLAENWVLCFGGKWNFRFWRKTRFVFWHENEFLYSMQENEFCIFSGKWFFILAEEWFFILMRKWVFSFHFWPNVTLSLPKITNQFYPSKTPRIKNSVRRLALMNWTHLRFLKIFYINQDGMRNTYCWSWLNAKSINQILINGKLVFHKEPNKSSKRSVRL